MSILTLYLPESGVAESVQWTLRDGTTLRTGTGAYADLPAAAQTVVILAASRILLTHVKLPDVGTAKLRDLLPYAVEEKLLAEPESIHVIAAARRPSGDTPVAIIDRAWLRQQLAALAVHGIRPHKMLPETLLPRLESNGWSMVWHGHGGFVRTGANAGFAVDGGDARTPPIALSIALDEARAAQNAPTKLMLYLAHGATQPDWSQALHLMIENRGAWTWQDADPGAAQAFNLLQGEFVPPRKQQHWRKTLRPAAMLVGVMLAVHLLGSAIDWARLAWEKRQLQQEMRTLFQQSFPEAVAIVDPALQMQRNLSQLRRAHGASDNADFLLLLGNVAPALPQAKIFAVKYEQDQLQIELSLDDPQQQAPLLEKLQKQSLQVEMTPLESTKLRLRIRPGSPS